MGRLLFELDSLDVSGTNSVVLTPDKPGHINIESTFARVTTVLSSTTATVAKLYSTGNPYNDSTVPDRLNTYAGTITVTDATNTVTGSSTTFTTEYVVGDILKTNGGNEREIVAIASDTSMTVKTNWSATESGVAHSRGKRHIGTLTLGLTEADGNTVSFVPVDPTDPTIGREDRQPRANAPFFDFVGGDTMTVTVTTVATSSGVVTPYLCLEIRDDLSTYPV